MADVGLVSMPKVLGLFLAAVAVFSVVGCSAGEISPDMQKKKNDALRKASEKEGSMPKEDRGRE